MLRVLILSIFTAAGALVIYYSFSPVISARKASSWPTTSAVITDSSVEQETFKRKRSGNTNRTIDSIKYRPTVAFEYVVKGEQYTGTTLSFSMLAYSSAEGAQSVLVDFEPGSMVDIHYNPDNPQQSVVLPTGEPAYLFTYFGALIVITGIWMIVVPYLKRKTVIAK